MKLEVGRMFKGNVIVDGTSVAGAYGDDIESVTNQTLYYASQYTEEVEKRMTITIIKEKE